jgi:starch synthase (maltosyl-transferring)
MGVRRSGTRGEEVPSTSRAAHDRAAPAAQARGSGRRKERDVTQLNAPADGRRRVHIDRIEPEIDGGRSAAKRIVGDLMKVAVDLLIDGHDIVRGVVLYRHERDADFREVELVAEGNDRFTASFPLERIGTYLFTVEGWADGFATWRRGLARKVEAGQDVSVELLEGAALLATAAAGATGADAEALQSFAETVGGSGRMDERVALALSPVVEAAASRAPDRSLATRYPRVVEIVVEPRLARFSAWYELFPRSCGPEGKHGTLRDVEARLPYVAEMGFDVLYLPPIHPIGLAHRKGPDNSETAGPDDPGSPWAIGSERGGHTSVHPDLGTIEDLDRLVESARAMGIEIALDIAFQASPDHPWVREHPQWFRQRPDGSVQYAENPPKKYQDVYPFDFETDDWEALWRALRGVFLFWIEHGVRVFRVDNPHTKPIGFWRWCIRTIKQEHPEVLFLAEAFTRPKMMAALAKAGFSQSYTYFTWRTSGAELTRYLEDLTQTELSEYFRPNFWPNTPDILPEHLQHGGRPVFLARLVLAATLSSSYGIYGPPYELMEHVARPGAEEYARSEKYEIRAWDLDRPESLRHVVARLNAIRRENPALQSNDNLRFHETSNDLMLCFSKRTSDHLSVVLVVVNMDPHHKHSAWIDVDLSELGVRPDESYQVHDVLADARFLWRGARSYVELDPALMPAHVLVIRRLQRTERNFEYYL